ncbi:MAG: hypothetical protein WC719_04660 [Patescibacteria group bacterium]|jgi:hypothetical protein
MQLPTGFSSTLKEFRQMGWEKPYPYPEDPNKIVFINGNLRLILSLEPSEKVTDEEERTAKVFSIIEMKNRYSVPNRA